MSLCERLLLCLFGLLIGNMICIPLLDFQVQKVFEIFYYQSAALLAFYISNKGELE